MAKNLQTVARRALTPCAGEDAFRFADGTSARDLEELRARVASRSMHLVAHHRDEYGPWIERVLCDPALARRVERTARRRTGMEEFRDEVLGVLDERIGTLRARVV